MKEIEVVGATGIRYPWIPTLTPDYVTGLCDGEGSFTFGRTTRTIRPRFSLALQDWDKNLIFALHDFFGVGGVYYRKPQGNRLGVWTYCASSRTDLAAIIDHFLKFPLRGTKRENFQVWERIYRLGRNPRGNWFEMQDLADTLSRMSTKGRKPFKPRNLING